MSKMYLVSRNYDNWKEIFSFPLMTFKSIKDIQKWAKDVYGIPCHEIKMDRNGLCTYAHYRDRRFDKNKGKWIEDRRWLVEWLDDENSVKDISQFDEDSGYRFGYDNYMEIKLVDVIE